VSTRRRPAVAVAALLAVTLAGAATAQQVSNARVERHTAADPAAVIATLGAEPTWLGWRVPGSDDAARLCCFDGWNERRCRLDGRDNGWGSSDDWPAAPNGGSELVVLVELAGGRPVRLRAVGASCPVAGGGRRLVALDGVDPRASLELLARWANDPATGRDVAESALAAIGHHADGVLELLRLMRTTHRAELRRQALFWLAQSEDPRALDELERILER